MEKKRLEGKVEPIDPEEDYNMLRGKARADFELSKRNYRLPSSDRKSLKEILKYTPEQIRNHPHIVSFMKRELSNLKKAGYLADMDFFNRQNEVGKWNYYMKFLEDNGYFDSP